MVLGQFPWDNPPRKLLSLENCPPENSHLGQLPLKDNCLAIAPGINSQENSHLGLRSYPWIIKHCQLLPRAMTITNYNFFMAIFYFWLMAELYNFCYTTKIIVTILIKHGV